jgi:putative ABC transport system permease protein
VLFFHRTLSPRLGATGRLAGQNLQKNVSRNGIAVAAICFSIGLYICSANAMYSVRTSMFDWIDSIVRADLLISSGHPLASGGAANIPMPDSLSQEIAQVAGVRSVEVYRKGYVNYQGKKILLEIFDVGLRMEYCPGLFTKGNRTDIARDVPNNDLIVVNEGFAAKYHVNLGDSITLPTPNGPVRFGIAGVTVGYACDSGAIWLDINTYRRHWHDTLVDTFEVLVNDKAKIPEIRQTLLERLGKDRHLFILPAWEFKQEIRKILDHSFVVNNVVNIIVLIIAGSGIIITLLASVLERTREIGVLRAIGMTRGQIARVLILESALLGAIGGLLGVILGIPLGWISLEAFFRLDYGESIVYHIHLATMGGAVFLAVALATMAGFYPARRAARINIVEALSYE